MEKYTFFDHTADVGIIAYGNSLEELFLNAAMAVFETIAELESIIETVSIKIEVESETVEELIVEWLRELLYQHGVREVFFKRVEINSINETSVSAIAYGEPILLSKHIFNTEIKNITYHKLKVEKLPDNTWQAQIVLDL